MQRHTTTIESSIDTLVTIPGDTATLLLAVAATDGTPRISTYRATGSGNINLSADVVPDNDGYVISVTAETPERDVPVHLQRRETRHNEVSTAESDTDSSSPVRYYVIGIVITLIITYIVWRLIKKAWKR